MASNSMYGLDDKDEEVAVEHWRGILEKWPDSLFAPYAMYFLASHRRWNGDPEGAIDLYERLLNTCGRFAYAEKAQFDIVDCYQRLGMTELAEQKLADLRAKYPGSDLANPAELGRVE